MLTTYTEIEKNICIFNIFLILILFILENSLTSLRIYNKLQL